jgi:sodium/hydrogen antiporter
VTALLTVSAILIAYTAVSVVRILPVAVAMAGTDARWQTVAFMGWFGPRGLASVVFGLLALERGIPQAPTLLATVVVTVGLSVFLHGLTSVPFVAGYHRWYAAKTAAHPSAAEAKPPQVPRGRRRLGSNPATAAEDSTRQHPLTPWEDRSGHDKARLILR